MADLSEILANQPIRVDMSEEMTDKFYADPKVHKGMVLGFRVEDQEEPVYYRIVRLNRQRKKCEAVKVDLFKEDEVGIEDVNT